MNRHRIFVTFAPGFERAAEGLLAKYLPDMSDLSLGQGSAFFSLSRLPNPADIPFCNNVFLLLREWRTADCPFPELVKQSARKSALPEVRPLLEPFRKKKQPIRSFRVRYSRANQFCSVDKKIMADAAAFISKATGLCEDRVGPDTEFWFIVRTEGWSAFAWLLPHGGATEKALEQGELRPETALLSLGLAQCGTGDFGPLTNPIRLALDPFAGYGSLPEALSLAFPQAEIVAVDSDPRCADHLAKRFRNAVGMHTCAGDARRLYDLPNRPIGDASVDLILTDPPWGFWEKGVHTGREAILTLYRDMLKEFSRVISPHGRVCVLSGAKSEFEEAVSLSPPFAHNGGKKGFRTDILINGKKSACYLLEPLIPG